MTSDRHYPGEPVFPDLAMIGRIETEVERNGKIGYETRYYLCSLALGALIADHRDPTKNRAKLKRSRSAVGSHYTSTTPVMKGTRKWPASCGAAKRLGHDVPTSRIKPGTKRFLKATISAGFQEPII